MRLYIKNMVCNRCVMVVKQELENLKLHPEQVALGEVVLKEHELSETQHLALQQALQGAGFELISDRNSRIIEKIKNVIIAQVHHSSDELKQKFSSLISSELHHDYSYLSKLFSEVEGTTIEQYIISQKIEKVKELLVYDELSLTQIADKMGYSSVAHLSAQFKKVTGLPPSHFKHIGSKLRKPLDNIS
ncbi:MAG: AraC family transcriptional regulator [Bacteroidetes bacterium 46-16]|nr:MAG: AraC family transcriptional regulator [Bacteroidetes bacterium 46-16]